MIDVSDVSDEAVEAAWDAYVVNAHNDPMRAALTAALPHLVFMIPGEEINVSMLEELKATRSDVQPLLKAANEGAAEIVRLNVLVAERDAEIASLQKAARDLVVIARRNTDDADEWWVAIHAVEAALKNPSMTTDPITAAAALLRAHGWWVKEPKCETCGGKGTIPSNSRMRPEDYDCPTCNGTGALR